MLVPGQQRCQCARSQPNPSIFIKRNERTCTCGPRPLHARRRGHARVAVGCTKYGGRIGNYPETQGWIPVVNARDETCNSYGGGKALECARPPPPPLQCACGCGRHRLAHPAGTSRRLREGEFRRGATPGAPLLPPRLIPIHASPDHVPVRTRIRHRAIPDLSRGLPLCGIRFLHEGTSGVATMRHLGVEHAR